MPHLELETPIKIRIQQEKITDDISKLSFSQFNVTHEDVYGPKPANGPAALIDTILHVSMVVISESRHVVIKDILLDDQTALKALMDTPGYDATLEALFNEAIASGKYNK